LYNLEARESHYSRFKNPDRKYLQSDYSITRLYNDFTAQNPNVSPFAVRDQAQIGIDISHCRQWLFENIFNFGFNIAFGYPRSDICERCEQYKVKHQTLIHENKSTATLGREREDHLREADNFYASMKIKVLNLIADNVTCLCFDFQKNLPLPVTNVSAEFFCRQLWLYNFGVHDLKTGQSTMYVHAETFAKKGSNEVSALKHYIDNYVAPNMQGLQLWCDNSCGQNKNSYISAYLSTLNERFEEIQMNFPVPGHSRMQIDGDFAHVEKLKKKSEKFNFPSDWVNLIKSSNKSKPVRVIYMQHPLTDDLTNDGTPVVTVCAYKAALDPVLKPFKGISKIRGIRFLEDGTVTARRETTGPCTIPFSVIKPASTLLDVKNSIATAPQAYQSYVPVTKEKSDNVRKLLKSVYIPTSCIFYESVKTSAEIEYENEDPEPE